MSNSVTTSFSTNSRKFFQEQVGSKPKGKPVALNLDSDTRFHQKVQAFKSLNHFKPEWENGKIGQDILRDLSAAFDSLLHQIHLRKLGSLISSPSALFISEIFLNDCFQQVCVNRSASKLVEVKQGVDLRTKVVPPLPV